MFKLCNINKYLLACLALTFVFVSCKQPETLVIDSDPVSNPNSDTIPEDTATAPTSADFMQLAIGELNPINSLDPLFVDNTGTMRTLQLAYEGLVRNNEDENVVPAIAKKWTVSTDSLTYTFTLRNDVYYHDSEVFANGLGRKLVARDVRFIFERMASVSVPGNASNLFMNIFGFEPYFQEQHNVYNPQDRQLQTITGIATPNDSTVTFRLESPDSQFLQKLASPYALIYPREALASAKPSSFKAIGSGPFRFSQKENGSTYIFSKFKNYYGPDPLLSRVDVISGKTESELFQALAKGEIDFIPEMGPQMLQGAMGSTNELKTSYRNTYNLHQNNSQLVYLLNYNTGSIHSKQAVSAINQLIDSTFSISEAGNFVGISILQQNDGDASLPDTTIFSFTEDPFTIWFTGLLKQKIVAAGNHLQIQDIRTPTRNTSLYYTQDFSLTRSNQRTRDSNVLTEFYINQLGISRKQVEGIPTNRYPWWMDLRKATISDSNN